MRGKGRLCWPSRATDARGGWENAGPRRMRAAEGSSTRVPGTRGDGWRGGAVLRSGQRLLAEKVTNAKYTVRGGACSPTSPTAAAWSRKEDTCIKCEE